MQINLKQAIAIIIAVLSVFSGSTAQLTDLFGSGIAKIMISFSSLATTTLSSVLAVISSTSQQFKDVSNTTGVEPIRINKDASPALAALAVDPKIDNIAPTMSDRAEVEAKASGAAA